MRITETFLRFVRVFMQYCFLLPSYAPSPQKIRGAGHGGILHGSHLSFFLLLEWQSFYWRPGYVSMAVAAYVESEALQTLPEMRTSLFRQFLAPFLCPLFNPFLERGISRGSQNVSDSVVPVPPFPCAMLTKMDVYAYYLNTCSSVFLFYCLRYINKILWILIYQYMYTLVKTVVYLHALKNIELHLQSHWWI